VIARWWRRVHGTDWAIILTGYAALGWIFWATWHGIDPVAWFR
jgi:hypothetical protein